MMREAMQESRPEAVGQGEWHLPFVREAEIVDIETPLTVDGLGVGTAPWHAATDEERVKLSVGRCARVSYLTQDGKRDVAADLALYDRLKTSGHLSPFEHAARVATYEDVANGKYAPFVGNLSWPWIQHRKDLIGEAVFGGAK